MFDQSGWFWTRIGLAFFVSLAAGCRRQPTATNSSTTTPAVVVPLPTTRAAGEFVRTPRRIVPEVGEVRIPIELVTYMPALIFTSNDGVQRRLLLDTGADSVLMTPALVAAQHLTTRPSDRGFHDASGDRTHGAVALVDKLGFGVVEFEDFDADVSELFSGSDALLGWPMWRERVVTIDYPRRMLVLKSAGLAKPDGKHILPLKFEHDRLMVKASLDGREMWLNLDTGWGVGDSIELTTARAAEVAWAYAPVSTMATQAPGGAAAEKLGRLKGDLVLGAYRFVQPVAGTNGGVVVDVLGAVALSNFSVTLDLKNMRARFERADEEPIRPGPVFVAGFDCDLRSNPLKVTGVLPGSEAQRAGLVAGDLLLTIDGRLAKDGLLAHGDGAFDIERQHGEVNSTVHFGLTKLVP